MSVAGIVLAAGSGTRFGGPKALATTGERTWLEIVTATLLEGGCRPVVVVLGASAAAARAGVRIDRLPVDELIGVPAVTWVVNDAWMKGRAGSLQCGLRAVHLETTGVVIHAVDHPDVRSATVAALVAAHQAALDVPPTGHGIPPSSASPVTRARSALSAISTDRRFRISPAGGTGPIWDTRQDTSASVFLPVHLGLRGHPVLLARAVWPEVFALAPDDSLRTVVHRDAARRRDVNVDDPGILHNRNERESADTSPAAHPMEGDL
jgi:CTP:molybdopterin cytidylyltransferase MocA